MSGVTEFSQEFPVGTIKLYQDINKAYFNTPAQYSSITMYELPFRVNFTNIRVPGYSPTEVPPIGIAVIGINNYII